MNKSVKGLVLKSVVFKDNDLLLTIFTAETGKMNVLCRGIRRSKKTQLYAQPFVYSEFDLFCGRGLAVVDHAEVCEPFYNLRNDIQRLSLAQYFGDVASFITQGRNSKELLRLLLNSLSLLADSRFDNEIIKIVFELRYALIEGFAPSAASCSICGAPARVWKFDEGLLCQACAHHGGYPLSDAIVEAIGHILTTEGMRTYGFQMNEQAVQYLNQLTSLYISYQLDTDFQSLKYYRQFIDIGPLLPKKD